MPTERVAGKQEITPGAKLKSPVGQIAKPNSASKRAATTKAVLKTTKKKRKRRGPR